MSNSPDNVLDIAAGVDEPRRPKRARKQVNRFQPTHAPTHLRPGHDSDDEAAEERSDTHSDVEDAPPARKRKANGKAPTKPPTKRSRKAAAPKVSDKQDDEAMTGFKTDSPLFNALLSSEIALQPLVEEWVETYQGTTGNAQAEKTAVQELVQFFVRASGLGADVDEDEAMDQDGVGDTIERIQDESVNTNLAAYPLISKDKKVRPFKANLSSVISHLIATLALTPHLYDDADSTKHSTPLVPLLMSWLHSMTSSPLRPIRHTATFITLKINSALCEVAAAVSNELSIKQRQREAEIKKGGSTAAAKRRLKEAEGKVKETHERKTKLEEYLQENLDVVFVHRVRDADPAIRTDCLRELGTWVKKYPEKYVSSSFLNYFVRGTNDPEGSARLETVKAMAGLFNNTASANNASSFAVRVAPRLIQMASLDVEVSVRVNALHVVALIDKTGALEDEDAEERDKVARLIFDEEPRVRKAAAGFVKGLWEERAEQLQQQFGNLRAPAKKRAKADDDEMEKRFQWKALASLLVGTSKSLDQQSEEPGPSKQTVLLPPSTTSAVTTRASAAADALWSQVEILQDWQGLVDYLLLDHSTNDQDMWLLSEDEEDFLLDMLITSIKRDKDQDEEDERSTELMKVLPRLFTKHQSESRRMVGILSIPEFMNLSLYLDQRKGKAYESLWDDITKQFLHQTHPAVVTAAIQAINTLSANEPMATVNSQKLSDLEESLFTSLRDAVNGEDVSGMSLDEDQLSALEAILLRISLLARSRDVVDTMEDEEGGQSSGWTIVSAFAARGGLGYKEEAKMVEHALQIVFLHVTWLAKRMTAADIEDEAKVETLRTRRNEAVALFERFSVDNRTNAVFSVRRNAFIGFANLHTLFSAVNSESPAGKVAALEMASDKQHKLGGAFQAVVERYASDREDSGKSDHDDSELTAEEAQRDFTFLQLVAVFVGAIRCGVVDVELAKEPLAHVGRFSPAYDAVVKKLVDVLRDEGIYNRDATTVQHVVSEAIQNSFTMFLDTENAEPEETVVLARMAASAFVVHGTHFTVLKQIHADDVYDLHISNLDWLFRKVGILVKQQASQATAKDKDAAARLRAKRGQLLTFLKPLSLLLGPIHGRAALRIRQHLEDEIDKLGSGPAGPVRSSSGYKTYEKRLVTLAGKDGSVKAPPPKSAPKGRPSKKSVEIIEEVDDDDDMPVAEEQHEPIETPTENGQSQPAEPADPIQSPSSTQAPAASENGGQDEHPEVSPAKRSLPDDIDDELPDLDLNSDGGHGGLFDQGIDLNFSDTEERGRSASAEPNAKRRKVVG